MRYLGKISDWNDDKGYGFVTPNGGGQRAFVHIKAFERAGKRPDNGDLISYSILLDARGRSNAIAIRYAGAQRTSNTQHARRSIKPWFAFCFLGALLAGWVGGKLPGSLVIAYAAMSVAAIAMYRADKSAARRGGQRTPENTLHFVALLCGWPGAMLAQTWFRHKSKKPAFQAVFLITVAVNCGVLFWSLSHQVDYFSR